MVDRKGLLRTLSLANKVRLISGASMWRTCAVGEAGVPVLKVSDGPNGVRGDGLLPAASFPVGICMASTWNLELLQQLGCATAEEAKSKDVQVVLGPTINIHRTPLAGRNFECFSEDPYLSGVLAAAFTKGIQSQGVGACIKHYVCNDSEFERTTISSEVDERTLREIYLRPFEIAIEQSRPWAVMAAYNRINGIYACSHNYLVNDVLKGEWGFQGLVISDWLAANETVSDAMGGLDLEMPGPTLVWGDALLDSVREGIVSESVIDDKVRRLLRVLDWSGRFDEPEERPEQSIDKPAHRHVAYQGAVEGMVLLKNDGVLPLDESLLKRIAVIGPNGNDFQTGGGGSSSLESHYVSTPLAALKHALPSLEIATAIGCQTHRYIPAADQALIPPNRDSGAKGLLCRLYKEEIGSELVDELVITDSNLRLGDIDGRAIAQSAVLSGFYNVAESGQHEFGLYSTGKARLYVGDQLLIDNWSETEPGETCSMGATTERRETRLLVSGDSVAIRIEFEADPAERWPALRYGILEPQPEDAFGDAVALGKTADAVLLIVGTNPDWESEGYDRTGLELPGDQDELIRRVLAVNPNTIVVNNSGAPIAMPWLNDAPAVIQSWFTGQEAGNALVDIILGNINPSGKLPITFPKRLQDTPAYTNYPGEFGKVHYGEGIFVGYRWYDTRDIEPLFAFGHGLSYTTFDYREVTASRFDKLAGLVIRVKLKNSGDRDGKETVQVYVEAIDSPVARPRLELKAFSKVDLKKGEEKEVEILLDPGALAYWCLTAGEWTVTPGVYRIHIGSSSRDLRLVKNIEVAA